MRFSRLVVRAGLPACLLAWLAVAGLAAAPAATPATSAPAPESLTVGPRDVRIETSTEGGYLLVVRARAGLGSVILTESTADPARKLDSYTLRAPAASPLVPPTKRMLNGKLTESPGLRFLMSSDKVPDAEFGEAFRIFLPYVVVFGYPDARYGELTMTDGAFFNIRSFALPYADYAGAYRDNPYTIRLVQRPAAGLAGFNKEALRAYQAASSAGLTPSRGRPALSGELLAAALALPAGPVDLAFCVDATVSLEDDAPALATALREAAARLVAERPGSRVALVQYRDYMEDFLYRVEPFDSTSEGLDGALADYRPAGGRDTPEAAWEAVNACLTELAWRSANRLVLLVTDAPPHPIARGSVTFDLVRARLAETRAGFGVLLLPE